MGIYVEVQGLDNEKIFTSYEPVKGWVCLKLGHSTVISDIKVSLEGTARTSIIKERRGLILRSDALTVTDENHTLFKIKQDLFPHAKLPLFPGGYALSEGEYTFPFELRFPLQPKCSKFQPNLRHIGTVLPPSFEARGMGQGAEAKIEYVLKIDIQRPGWLQKSISIQRKLIFLPLDPAPYLIPSSRSGYYARQGALFVGDLERSLVPSNLHSPRQLPIVLLEAKLPSPPILYPGESLPLHIFVRGLPTQIDYFLPIRLRSLAITLQSTTVVAAGTHHTSWLSSQSLLNLKGLSEAVSCVRGTEVLSEINHSDLQNATIPKITPSFTTCAVEQKYSLDVEAEFSLGEIAKLRPIKVALNVEIWSGTGAGEELYRTTLGNPGGGPLVPLRPGCLAHLGVAEAVADDRGPPPY